MALLVGVMASLCGCSLLNNSADRNESNDMSTLSPKQMEEEYWGETKGLTLPENAAWPAVRHQSPAPDHQGILRDHVYEVGYGAALAQDAWFCIWQKEWLARRGNDAEREGEALRSLLRFKDMANYRERSDQSLRALIDNLLEKASLGDPSLVANNVEVNCPKD
jgi:hypothetical protein